MNCGTCQRRLVRCWNENTNKKKDSLIMASECVYRITEIETTSDPFNGFVFLATLFGVGYLMFAVVFACVWCLFFSIIFVTNGGR